MEGSKKEVCASLGKAGLKLFIYYMVIIASYETQLGVSLYFPPRVPLLDGETD